MSVTLDIRNLAAARVGAHGLSDEELARLDARATALRSRLAAEFARGQHAYLGLGDDDEALERVLRLAQSRMGRFGHLVVLGIGGSALGLRAVVGALARPGESADLHIVDSTDPWLFADVMARIELKRTLFVVISKSGGTLETVAALGLFVEKLRAASLPLREHLIAVTDPESGPLRAFARAHDLDTADIPPAVGGRFSVLTAAGLLPVALLNIDIAGLLRGAAVTRQMCLGADPAADWPTRLGLCAMDLYRLGKTSLVFMPYSARLRDLAHWFVQLWDESLGKESVLDGKRVQAGQTAIPAVGPTDQHAQMQLFLDGPNDKLLLFLRVARHESDFKLGAFDWDGFDAAYVRDRSLGEVMDSQLAGTVEACTQKGRANATLTLPVLDAASLGEVLMGLQAATSVAGMALGVNAYDQPAVELGKRLSRRMLGGK
ncbi:MAG: glucose-6-phosphate isomerase [Planctomycetes bacterium]|nr:glucose-6-phosphate isomerase [Planctomycetota bacterium]